MSEDEFYNPYYGTCSKHGFWKGSYDECPKCMELEYRDAQDSIPNSICWNCRFGSEPDTKVYCEYKKQLSTLAQIPRKKHCKHYQQMLDYDQHGEL